MRTTHTTRSLSAGRTARANRTTRASHIASVTQSAQCRAHYAAHATTHAGGHEQVGALGLVEGHHSNSVADAKCAEAQRLDEVSDDMKFGSRAAEGH